jgi:hypothetical protein
MGTPSFAAANPVANLYLANVLDKMQNGKEMRRLAVERQALLTSLKATGLAQPATILNFNPVALALDGGIGFKVPSILDESVLDDNRFFYKFEGREYKASVLTIREPRTFLQIKDVKVEDEIASGIYEVKACKQIEIAHCFFVAYTLGTLGSAVGMGGVVAFEGDRRQIMREKTKRIEVRVPTYIRLENRTREYITETKDFDEIVGASLKLQKRYANFQTQEAQSYWDKEDQRGNITPVHRIWHQYEMDMGWRQVAAPWVTLTTESAVTCPGCGEPKKRVEAFACWKCARVYDPFSAYMAKEIPASHPSMERLEEKDWPVVQKEEARRKALRAGI